MKKIISILSFFLILYTPYIVGATSVEDFIGDTKDLVVPYDYSVKDATQEIMDGKNIVSFSAILNKIFSAFAQELKNNLSFIVKMVVIGILSGIATSMFDEKNDIGVTTCVAIVSLLSLQTFLFVINIAESTIDTLFMFMQGLMPTVTTVVSATGQVAQMSACGSMYVAMQIFIHLCKDIVLPLVAVITALGVANSLGDALYLKGILQSLKSFFKWGTGLLLTLYGGVVGVQTLGAAGFDSMTGKTIKYAVGSFVPVVGSALSDSMEMIKISAKTVKNALGISGIIGILYICIQPLMQVCVVALAYKLGACICSVATDKRSMIAINEVGENIIRVCGVILSVGIMFIISLAMLCRMGGVI